MAQDVDFEIDSIPTTAFFPGEELKYEVSYGIIKGGEASVSVGLVPNGNGWLYHAQAVATTAGLAQNFFTIYDVYETYMNVLSCMPVKAIRNISEEKYRYYNEVWFFRDSLKVLSLRSGYHQVPENVLDILSAFYYARSYLFRNVKTTDTIILNTFFDDELLPIKIKLKKIDILKSKFGKIECLLFVPIIENGSPFANEKDLKIWITNDNNFIPLRIRAKIVVGSINCDLIEFSGLGYEIKKE